MHHNGCKTIISDEQVRFVLNRKQYAKFIEFSDRSVLGDGINCLKCGCFVNLPTDSSEPMVQCPYCAYRFCRTCKCPWHPGVKCNDRADLELEQWRELQGAQRCPGCYRIIEKDDPETCNHMVHKTTDPMPCNRERTDFCYCCGVEVTPDYPHMEVDSPGTIHFPDGVFQDCRAVTLGYATMLQKRRFARRQRADDNSIVGVIGDNAFGNFFGAENTTGARKYQPQQQRRRRAECFTHTLRTPQAKARTARTGYANGTPRPFAHAPRRPLMMM